MKETVRCHQCGCIVDSNNTFYIGNDVYCRECYNEVAVRCEYCGEIVHRDNIQSDGYHNYCNNCYNNHFVTCSGCGRIIYSDCANYYGNDSCQEEPYCDDCYDSDSIREYCYKPSPLFKGSGNRFFGVELEVDDGGKDYDVAAKVLDIANDNNEQNIYIKSDGSLEDGFEIVTHPMTLEYHQECMKWETVMNRLLAYGYLSHNTDTCGLHVHVNRTSLGNSYEEQEAAIARILYFVERHWDKLLKFSRRTMSQINRWAARYDLKENPKVMYDNIKESNIGRYRCVNLENRNTIEFRLFRGTLKYSTLIATLQFIDELCNVAVSLCDEQLLSLSWNNFIERFTGNDNESDRSELIEYLKRKEIYIEEE